MTAYRPDPDDGFTDRQRTRVYRRAAPSEPASIGNTQIMQKEEGLFDGITLPQVIAGAAAAATSVLLASKIGIGGSVIGAAVSSVVTVVSSQLYRKFLTAGARKLKQGKDLLGTSHSGAGASSGNRIDNAAEVGRAYGIDSGASAANGAWHARVAPASLQARAMAERAATQRKVVGFSVLIAVVAVIACVVTILLSTAGEGIGTRPESLFTSSTGSVESETEDEGTTQVTPSTADGSTDADATDEPASTDDSASTAGDGGAAGSAGAGTDADSSEGTGSGTGNGEQDSTGNPSSPSTGEGTGTDSSSGAGAGATSPAPSAAAVR